jgi:hypothetical protein
MKNSSFWEVVLPRVLSTYAILTFVFLWVGFAVALIADRSWLETLWEWLRALPLGVEISVWVLFLPITVGLWIWESSWPLFGTILASAGLFGWTLLAVSSFVRAGRKAH